MKPEIDPETVHLVLKLKRELNWSIPSITYRTKLSKDQVINVFKKHHQKLKDINEKGAQQSHIKKRKLKEEHKSFIKDLIILNPQHHWTWNKILSKLRNQFGDNSPVHNSTISRCMSKHLGLSYKKLELKRPPALTLFSYRKWLESVLIQIELEKRDVEIIYIDEFHVNTRNHRFRGWTKKGEKSFITVDSKDFSMSFFWALSKTRVLGLMGKEETSKSEIVKHYLKCMF